MLRTLLVSCIVAVALARCDCGDDPGPTGPTPPITPTDTTNAEIDSTLYGMWHRYAENGSLLAQNFVRITPDSIVVSGSPTLKGVVDDDPNVARSLVATAGQIYLRPSVDSLPRQYFYDYTLISATLYLVAQTTSDATEPTGATPGVFILRRGIDTIIAISIISDSLIGTWDKYDSTGTVLTEQRYLVITPDSIVYRPTQTPIPIVFRGILDTIGTTGRTLTARNGQIWYDYHYEGNTDMYWYDYAMFNGGQSMYFADDNQSTYSNPGPDSEFIVHYLKKR